jgi:hypothetical protein
VTVLDLSDDGALVEGEVRLLPGTHVEVHVMTREGRILARSRVVRAHVSQVRADRVLYRGGLMFERVVDTTPYGYAVPEGSPRFTGLSGTSYPRDEAGGVVRSSEDV